jgi:hypothetical protein
MLGWGPSFTTKLSAFIFGRLATDRDTLMLEVATSCRLSGCKDHLFERYYLLDFYLTQGF